MGDSLQRLYIFENQSFTLTFSLNKLFYNTLNIRYLQRRLFGDIDIKAYICIAKSLTQVHSCVIF